MTEKLLKVSDVVKKLNISRRTVYYWIKEGILKTVRIGGIYRFHPEDIETLIRNGREATLTAKVPRILAIDDDILVRESIKPLLERSGFSVTVASDGSTALGLVKIHEFDLILTDMRMPGMDGLETLQAIRGLRQQQGKELIPEIVVTAYDDPEVVAKAKTFGIREFVLKPFELKKFLAVIQHTLTHTESASPAGAISKMDPIDD